MIGCMNKLCILIAAAITASFAGAEDPTFDAEALDFFESRVRPVLAEHCYTCHGTETQKAGLRLDARSAILQGGDSGPAIVAGDPNASLLAQVIRYDGDVAMPPKEKLPDDAIEALNHWITLGAPWPEEAPPAPVAETDDFAAAVQKARETHWAFQPVTNPAPPESPQADWARQELDHFIAAKLAEAELTPANEADRRTLIRRLYFDLIGLPPDVEAVEAFAANDAPDAYEKLVDELLASEHFGERWGRYWLDVARYADTRGYVFQRERAFAFSHTYRDFVIDAFNNDLPYDDFLRYQVAADKLAGDNQEVLAAMGFLTLGRNFVGNVHDQTDDKIDVVTRGMLGLTVSCARCHDHKYDPVSIEDYYSLYGVFRSSIEPNELPLIEEPDPEDPLYQEFQAEVAAKEQELQDYITGQHVDMLTGARERAADYLHAATTLAPDADTAAIRTLAKDKDLLWQILEGWRNHLKPRAEGRDTIFKPWFDLAALPAENFAEAAKAFWSNELKSDAYRNGLNPVILRALGDTPPENLEGVVAMYAAAFKEADDAWTKRIAAATQAAAQTGQPPAIPDALGDGNLEAVRQVLYGKESPVNVPRGNVEDYSTVPIQGQIRNRRNARVRVESTHPGRPDRAMVLNDAAQLFNPYVFKRGKAESRGEDVPRRLPLLLAGQEPEVFAETSGRERLAEVIASKDNPLTARVFVNRVWGKLFGQYLVDTPSDFGVRATPPTHPELLDHLAHTFMEDGWSMKHLIRRIVLSATYRQTSTDRPEARAKDEANRLYWRQNRRRLDFEAMRDSILAASGTLDEKMGGPAVEIANEDYAPRRTIYGRIERQNLPGLFRTFDFASPDTHSPMRFTTTVPQQALYLMNSPFAVEQARALADRPEVAEAESEDALINTLFREVLQRDPAPEEFDQARLFLEETRLPERETPRWEYGYGLVDLALGETFFTPYPAFVNNQYQGVGDKLPTDELGWSSLRANGGHPGDATHASVLRWNAPGDGKVRLRGRLSHGTDQGDGVHGIIVHSGSGVAWEGRAFNDKLTILLKTLHVNAGDTVDIVVACGENTSHDSFGLETKITWIPPKDSGQDRQVFVADEAFGPPAPEPLAPAEQLAQVMFMTNEFMFID
jgi:cytochrome c553